MSIDNAIRLHDTPGTYSIFGRYSNMTYCKNEFVFKFLFQNSAYALNQI